MARLEPLSAVSTAETLAYLARRPFENVYLYWLIATGQTGRSGEVALWRDPTGAVAGCCSLGSQIVVVADDPRALEAFAGHARHARGTRMIVGARSMVEPLWRRLRATLPAPSSIRTSQPLYAVARDALAYSRADAEAAQATLAELDEIAANSALMIAGELGGDPRRTNADFIGRTARIIEAGWWWRYRVDGALAFMCNVGSTMPQTSQLQGVWSPVHMRGRGYAARALGSICDRLLDSIPTLSLYVNDFNRSAIALYERVGFSRVGEFQTILF